MCVQLFRGHVIAGFACALVWLSVSRCEAKKAKPCPQGCTCESRSRKNPDEECEVLIQCMDLAAFPFVWDYPPQADCLWMMSPKLGKLSAQEKEAGLRALPTTLRRLDLSTCGLAELPAGDALGRLVNLRVLNLEFNKLKSLPKEAFHGLEKLKVLWLTGNHYDEGGHMDYEKMKTLGNRLAALDKQQFKGLKNLQVLLMHHNRLTKFPIGVLKGLTRLKVLKLFGNPFKPILQRGHKAFSKLLAGASPVLYQLDLEEDSGNDLEDEFERTYTFLADDFDPKQPPPPNFDDWKDPNWKGEDVDEEEEL